MGVFSDRRKSKIATLAIYGVLLFALVMVIITLLKAKDEQIVYDPMLSQDGTVESNSPSLMIYRYDEYEKINVGIANMMPGDLLSKTYSVEVSAKEETRLFFKVTPQDRGAKLNEVLKVKVLNTDSQEVLYDGTVNDMPANITRKVTPMSEEREAVEINYEITVYLDGSVGNEYQAQNAAYDFDFWVEDTDALFLPKVSDFEFNSSTWFFIWVSIVCLSTAVIFTLGSIIYKAIHKERQV